MKVPKRGLAAAALALAVAASAVPLVLADVRAISDPRDSRGKLDVIRAEAAHMRNVPGFVKHVIAFEDRNGHRTACRSGSGSASPAKGSGGGRSSSR